MSRYSYGEVTQAAVKLDEFIVEKEGKPLSEVPLKAPRATENLDDPELAEWAARVAWHKTFPKEEAKTFKNLFLGAFGIASEDSRTFTESEVMSMTAEGLEKPEIIEAAEKAWQEQGVESPFFKRWFAGSKVVDDEGKPQAVYHGTKDDIESFDNSKGQKHDSGWLGRGFYFTTDANIADFYARQKIGDGGAKVLPAYLNIKKPFYATIRDKERLMLADRRGEGKETSALFRDELVNKGHDGVILDYGSDDGLKEIVVFSPEQIKSTFNRGTFNEGSDKILESV